MMLATALGKVQENLDKGAVEDIHEGHSGRGVLKAVASGAIDGILINGFILTGACVLSMVCGVVQKVKK